MSELRNDTGAIVEKFVNPNDVQTNHNYCLHVLTGVFYQYFKNLFLLADCKEFTNPDSEQAWKELFTPKGIMHLEARIDIARKMGVFELFPGFEESLATLIAKHKTPPSIERENDDLQ